MPIITFTESELLRGTVVTPAWYRVRIDSVGEEPAAIKEGKTPSTNYPIEGTILFNGDTGDTQFAGVPLGPNNWMFNSKAIGFSKGFLLALGVEVRANTRFELKVAEGHQIDVFVENDTYQGRITNRINHKYRPIREDVHAVVKGE